MFDFSDFHLTKGGGYLKDWNNGVCIMQAVRFFSDQHNYHRGQGLNWHPECASPSLSMMAIMLNDTAPSQEHRDSLWSLLFTLINSRDEEVEEKRESVYERISKMGVSMQKPEGWCAARDALIEAIHMGKHGEEDKAYEPRYLKLREILSV